MSEYELINKKLEEIKAITLISAKKVYTVGEAALYMGMSTEYVRRMCKTRKIKSYRSSSGKGIYLHQSDLDKWMMHTEVNTDEFLDAEASRICRRLSMRN